MVRTDKLRGLMAEKNVAGVDMAKALNIAPKTFYSKMKSGKFGTDEAEIMIDVLEIPNPTEIFFAKV